MTTEKVYSPVEDQKIASKLLSSPIWANCYHSKDKLPDGVIWCYTIKFDGIKPVQVTKIEKL